MLQRGKESGPSCVMQQNQGLDDRVEDKAAIRILMPKNTFGSDQKSNCTIGSCERSLVFTGTGLPGSPQEVRTIEPILCLNYINNCLAFQPCKKLTSHLLTDIFVHRSIFPIISNIPNVGKNRNMMFHFFSGVTLFK